MHKYKCTQVLVQVIEIEIRHLDNITLDFSLSIVCTCRSATEYLSQFRPQPSNRVVVPIRNPFFDWDDCIIGDTNPLGANISAAACYIT